MFPRGSLRRNPEKTRKRASRRNLEKRRKIVGVNRIVIVIIIKL